MCLFSIDFRINVFSIKEMSKILDKIDEYQKRYEEFCDFDATTLEIKLKNVPREKNFWVGQWTQARIEKDELEEKYKKACKDETVMLLQDKVALNERELSKAAVNGETPRKIKKQIKDMEHVIFYLEHAVKQFTFIGNDFKNLIEYKKLEYL